MSVLSVTWKVVQTVSCDPDDQPPRPGLRDAHVRGLDRLPPDPIDPYVCRIPDASMNGCSVLWIWLVNACVGLQRTWWDVEAWGEVVGSPGGTPGDSP